MLQPILLSPHLESTVRLLLGFFLAGSVVVGYQTEKEKRLAFVHELELLSQRRESAAVNIRIERQLALSKAEQVAEASRTMAEMSQRRQCEIEGDPCPTAPDYNVPEMIECITLCSILEYPQRSCWPMLSTDLVLYVSASGDKPRSQADHAQHQRLA